VIVKQHYIAPSCSKKHQEKNTPSWKIDFTVKVTGIKAIQFTGA
jgi:hypothetical protein